MKRLNLTFVLLIFSIFCYAQDLRMSLEIDSCIDETEINKVFFIIENATDSDYWLKANHLTFYLGVYSNNGQMVSRKTTRHINPIEATDYIKVDKKSKIKLEWRTDLFDNLRFDSNQKYYLESGYELTHLTRDEKKKFTRSGLKLAQQKFSGRSNLFEVCKI